MSGSSRVVASSRKTHASMVSPPPANPECQMRLSTRYEQPAITR